jgi:hypothetical protein
MGDPLIVKVLELSSWREILEAADYLVGRGFVFRGQPSVNLTLQTSLEREFGTRGAELERKLVSRFIRHAPRLLESHLVPASDDDAAAWLGLIQHYGGPTRLLDVTASPFVALYFAFEPSGAESRALWAVDEFWCLTGCAQVMAANEGLNTVDAIGRLNYEQFEVVQSLVWGAPPADKPALQSFKPFTGVFPLEPWKPDSRQSAQQAKFLCVANPALTFMQNLSEHPGGRTSEVLYRFDLAAELRNEVLEQLSVMSVTAATLFPDLTGLARSLRTYPLRHQRTPRLAPWETTR